MQIELTTAIIAGVAALAGVIISQAISITLSFLDKRHQKHILLRQKYEQLMFLFQDSLMYIPAVQNCRTVAEIQQNAYSIPAGRALGLSHLYFPSLVDPLTGYQQSLISFYGSVASVFDPNIPASAGAQLLISDESMSALKAVNKQKNKTLSTLIKNASNYTKA
jgi:hypothetical protein